MKMSEMQSTKAIIVIWGPGKIGKTVLASQFPNAYYVCVKEDGLGSVRSMKVKYKLDFDIKHVLFIHSNPTVDKEVLDLISSQFANLDAWKKLNKLATALVPKVTPDDFIIWDHWTYICDALVDSIETKVNHPMQLQDWNTFTQEMKDFLDIIKQPQMRASSVILAHTDMIKDDISGEIQRTILMPTRMKNSFPSYPTEYLFMKNIVTGAFNVRKVERLLQSLSDQSTTTGSYSLIPDLKAPTYEKIRPYLEASMNRKLPPPTWTPPDDKIPEPKPTEKK